MVPGHSGSLIKIISSNSVPDSDGCCLRKPNQTETPLGNPDIHVPQGLIAAQGNKMFYYCNLMAHMVL